MPTTNNPSFSLIYPEGNSHVVRVDRLRSHDDIYQHNATVTLETLVEDESGNAVVGVTTPLALSYIAASNGRYEAFVPFGTEFVVGGRYRASIRAVAITGIRREWVEPLLCIARRA